MNAKTKPPKKKLCWNCDGSVALEIENCPFCGVYLSPMNLDSKSKDRDLFSPPYKISDSADERIPEPPYKQEEESVKSEPANRILDKNQSAILLPLVLMLTGTQFFIFGFAMWLFAKNGWFSLQWNAAYWALYFIIGMTALLFGWRYLQKPEVR